MKKDKASNTDASETKSRIPVWLYPSTLGVIDHAIASDMYVFAKEKCLK